jgi:hypothetical protein
VWLNDGGIFTDSGQNLGIFPSYDVDLGDLDGDGDLDAFVANNNGQANRVYTNDGTGTFTDSGQALGGSDSYGVALGDVDRDGDLDAFVANGAGEPNLVYLNDGSGSFTDSGQALGSSYTDGVALGDVDRDGDLDALIANYGGSRDNRVWRNTGGSAGFSVTVTSISAGYIPDGVEDDLLRVIVTHNGLTTDRDLELHTWHLDLLASDCTTPLSSAQVNAGLGALRVRLDDGDGAFETGSDVEVAGVSADGFNLDGDGAQIVTFTNDDPNVRVGGTGSKTYWVSLEAPVDQGQLGLCVNFDPDADAAVEGKTLDFRVSVQDSNPIDSGSVPASVHVRTLAARPATPDRLILLASITALAILLLFRHRHR